MTVVDLLVFAVGAVAAWTGWRAGGLRTVVLVAGRLAGLFVGLVVAHLVADSSWSFGWRVLVEVVVVLLGLVVGGRAARLVPARTTPPSTADQVLGATVRGAVGLAVAAAVVAAVALWAPPGGALGAAKRSWTASAAGPTVSAAAGHVAGALPADLDGVIPTGASVRPEGGAALTAAEAAATVQVVVVATGGTSVGSGFVVAGDRVVTAHHVVDDGGSITVVAAGTRYPAVLTVDDARSDVAVLTVSGLDVAPVVVRVARVGAGTPVVIAGYPGGGPLRSGAGTVVGGTAMPAVEGSGVALRPAYRLAAEVRPGNSGGPVFTADGAVVGMVDARSLTDAGVGFAITAEPVLAALAAG